MRGPNNGRPDRAERLARPTRSSRCGAMPEPIVILGAALIAVLVLRAVLMTVLGSHDLGPFSRR